MNAERHVPVELSMVQRSAESLELQIRDVARLWQRSGRTPATIAIYVYWVRRYHIACASRSVDALANLTPAGVAQFARQYVGPRARRSNCPAVRRISANALRAWSWALRLLGYATPEWKLASAPAPLLPKSLQAYVEHRVRHRGVAPSTLVRDVDIAKRFLAFLRSRGRSTSTVRVTDIDSFVVELGRTMSARTVADNCSSLRAFLRFMHVMGRLRRDLAASVVAPRLRRGARLARPLCWTDVRRIILSVDRSCPRGHRDFAALLLMASYGMGSAELCAMQLEDVDWSAGVLHVRRAKTGVRIELPLMPAVASALETYLRHERPPHAIAREIFVTARLPHSALTGAAVRHLVRKHASAAGITAPILGAHVLRHSHASRQIDLSAPPKIVGDILGHRDSSSISAYVRVATRRLSSVGLAVPQ